MAGKNAPARDLPAEILAFYDAIVEKVAALRIEAHQTISHIKEEREELASQLQKDLAKGESLRKADFQELIGEIIEMRKAREKEVMDMLAQFQHEEQAVAQGLKKLFSDGKQARLHDFKKFLAETRRASRTRQAEIEEIAQASKAIRTSAEETIAAFRAEREAMAKSWRTLAEKMQERRSPKTTSGLKSSTRQARTPATLSQATPRIPATSSMEMSSQPGPSATLPQATTRIPALSSTGMSSQPGPSATLHQATDHATPPQKSAKAKKTVEE